MELILLAGLIINSVVLAYVLLHAGGALPRLRRRADADAPYANAHGQAVSQISPEDLTIWLNQHKNREIISMANVGQYVIIVYK